MRKLKVLTQQEREVSHQARYDELGQEIPDPTPIEVPLKFQVAETTEQKIQRILKLERFLELQGQMSDEDLDTANDFYVDEDPEPFTQHEFIVMAEDFLKQHGHKVSTKPPVKPTTPPATPPTTPPAAPPQKPPEQPQDPQE